MNIKKISGEVTDAFLKRARRLKAASRFVRLVLLVVAAAVAAIAPFFDFPPDGPTTWQIIGIAAAVAVALGAFFTAIVEEDASHELGLAHRAVEDARNLQEQYQDLSRVESEFEKSIELYQLMQIARGVLEQSTQQPASTEDNLVATILTACERSLPIAMGFAQADRWTICIYKAIPQPTGPVMLECLAHHRAIKCAVGNARKWAAGTGIAGSAFANLDEVIIDDLQIPSLQAVFGTAANSPKQDDAELYRSMAAVPVMVAGMSGPWGVVTATNDRPGHFSLKSGMGIEASEAVRALSAMIALAVACFRQPPRIPGP